MDCGLQIVGLEEVYEGCGLQTMDYASRGFYRDLGSDLQGPAQLESHGLGLAYNSSGSPIC